MDFLRLDSFHLLLAVLFLSSVCFFVWEKFRKKHNENDEVKNYRIWPYARIYRLASLFLSALFIFLAVLGPIAPWWEQSERKGIDLVWILDVSKSMDVRDIPGKDKNLSRLEQAKNIIEQYTLEHPENMYALVAFAWQARLVSPLTSQTDSLLTFLPSLDSSNIEEWGSNFRKALESALESTKSSDDPSTRALILLSDGGDPEDIGDQAIKNLFYGKNSKLFTIGIASEKGGPIPSYQDTFGNTTYKEYQGETVVSALNEENLKTLAASGGGKYVRSDRSDMEKALSAIEKHSITSSEGSGDSGRWFVLIGFLFFLLFIFVPSSSLKSVWNQ